MSLAKSFVWPVYLWVRRVGQGSDGFNFLLPHHGPEVVEGVGCRPLSGNETWGMSAQVSNVAGVNVIILRNTYRKYY